MPLRSPMPSASPSACSRPNRSLWWSGARRGSIKTNPARAEKIGAHGVARPALDAALARAGSALDWLRTAHANSTLPLLRLPGKTSDLDGIKQAAARLRAGASDVVVLGTGGSSLGGQTLAQLAGVGVRGLDAF